MQERFGWCFIGTGSIAKNVAKDSEGIRIVSAYSRNFGNVERFCQEFGGIPCETLEQAVTTPGVDGVYVATTNNAHLENVLGALQLGKPVLCEKPMGLHANQTRQMVSAAQERGLFLSEAMWVRYNPIMKTVMDWIKAGEIGDIHHVTADFSFCVDYHAETRFFNRSLGGGSILDMGIYPIAFAQMVYGERPVKIVSCANVLGGVDVNVSAMLQYAGGRVASIFSGFDTHSAWTAVIHGSAGIITIPKYWFARSATLERKTGECLTFDREGCKGYGYQTKAVEAMIREGVVDSPIMPVQESILIADIMDEILSQAGVAYKPYECVNS